MCRNCGAIVGAGQEACAMCGTLAGSAPQQQESATGFVADRETVRFARAVLSRPYIFTIIFLIANIFVFLLVFLSVGSPDDVARFSAGLVDYGGKMNSLIRQGEWWRFVTPIFLHGSWIHLFMNMYGLWILGPYVERLYGSAKFVVFWVVSGIGGVAASYLAARPNLPHTGPIARFLFKTEDAVSVGASGALFGLIGVLFVFGIKFRHELPENFKRAFGLGMLPTILINVFIGIIFPFIDNAAHLGGLVSGAALALLVGYKRPHERASIAITWHALQIAALALVAVSFWEVAHHYTGPPPKLENASVKNLLPGDEESSSVPTYLKALNAGQHALELAFNKSDPSQIDEAIKLLGAAPHLDAKSDELRDELKSILTRAKELTAIPPAQRMKPAARDQSQALVQDLQAWIKKRDEWVKTDGKKYGLKLVDPSPEPSAAPQQGSQK